MLIYSKDSIRSSSKLMLFVATDRLTETLNYASGIRTGRSVLKRQRGQRKARRKQIKMKKKKKRLSQIDEMHGF